MMTIRHLHVKILVTSVFSWARSSDRNALIRAIVPHHNHSQWNTPKKSSVMAVHFMVIIFSSLKKKKGWRGFLSCQYEESYKLTLPISRWCWLCVLGTVIWGVTNSCYYSTRVRVSERDYYILVLYLSSYHLIKVSTSVYCLYMPCLIFQWLTSVSLSLKSVKEIKIRATIDSIKININ